MHIIKKQSEDFIYIELRSGATLYGNSVLAHIAHTDQDVIA